MSMLTETENCVHSKAEIYMYLFVSFFISEGIYSASTDSYGGQTYIHPFDRSCDKEVKSLYRWEHNGLNK